MDLDADRDEVFLDDDESIPLAKRRRALPGPAFVTKAIDALPWNGDPNQLAKLKNPEAIVGLVLLDTWLGNPDRHPRRPPDPSISTWARKNLDNVLLARPPGKSRRRRLVAMDFSVCCHSATGGLRREFASRLVRDDGIYGLFPEFEPFVTVNRLQPFLDRLREHSALQQSVVGILSRIPNRWAVDARTRDGLKQFLCDRATYLADNFCTNLEHVVPLRSN